MMSRRRMTLQLTPLLDLLLIVMFSQYIESRDRTLQVQAAESKRDQELADLKSNLEAASQQANAEREQEFAIRGREIDDLRATYEQRFQSIVGQHHQVGTLLAEALNLPGAAMTEVLKLRTSGATDDAERLSKAINSLREFMNARGDEVFQTLIRFDEMQKHVSVWEVHLKDNGKASLTDGRQSLTIDFDNSTDFRSRLYEASKSFAEPRVLVVVLLSWGDTQAGQRKLAVDAMPMLMDQLRRDASGTRWYDFSILGFRANGPIVRPEAEPEP